MSGTDAAPRGLVRGQAPSDADDTRGGHLRSLAQHPVAVSLGATVVIAAFTAGALLAGPAVAAFAAAAAVLLVGVVLFAIATSRARRDFLRAYAATRRLHLAGKGTLPPATPLLRKGDRRYAKETMRGDLPGGERGALAFYTYEETTRDSEGRRQTSYHHFTVVICEVGESAPLIGELYVQRRSGFRFLDSLEDAFRTKRRVELESDALDRRFEIFADDGVDPVWLHQLFSPSFVVWLAEEAPPDSGFELVAGALCVNVDRHLDSATELDALCHAAGRVATRLREEALEGVRE